MISWKYAFERINRELDISNKKKQALDNLFNTGRISQATYNYVNQEISDVIAEIEARQKALADKMISKISDLEEQTKSLEMFLAGLEIRHVAGEIGEELYTKESSVLSYGLEATKIELSEIKNAVNRLLPEEVRPVTPIPLEVAEVPSVKEVLEKTQEIPMEASTKEVSVEAPVEVEVEESMETTVEASMEVPMAVQEEETPVEAEAVSEEATIEVATEAPMEIPFEAQVPEPTEVPIQVTPEEIIVEEEGPAEIPVEEAPTAEKFLPSEEVVEEVAEEVAEGPLVAAEITAETTAETATETTPEGAPTEETVAESVFKETPMEASVGEIEEGAPAEVGAPAEEISPYYGEEEAVIEEEEVEGKETEEQI